MQNRPSSMIWPQTVVVVLHSRDIALTVIEYIRRTSCTNKSRYERFSAVS
jgi:hypothetical protein